MMPKISLSQNPPLMLEKYNLIIYSIEKILEPKSQSYINSSMEKSHNNQNKPDNSDNTEIDYLTKLLNKPVNTRSNKDLELIKKYLETTNLIKNIRTNNPHIGDKIVNILSQNITSEQRNSGQIVFYVGDVSDKLYIILKGSISIHKPVFKTVYMSVLEYLDYIAYLKQINEQYLFERASRANQSIFDNILDNEYNRKSEYFTIYSYSHVLSLGTGTHFGDFGLEKNKGRSATIRCLDSTVFGVIDNKTYNENILNEKSKAKLKEITYFLNNFFFKNITIKTFENKLYQNFYLHEFPKGTILFKEGDALRYLYFIYEGKLEKTINMNVKKFYISR